MGMQRPGIQPRASLDILLTSLLTLRLMSLQPRPCLCRSLRLAVKDSTVNKYLVLFGQTVNLLQMLRFPVKSITVEFSGGKCKVGCCWMLRFTLSGPALALMCGAGGANARPPGQHAHDQVFLLSQIRPSAEFLRLQML